jgi:hypothetical protein
MNLWALDVRCLRNRLPRGFQRFRAPVSGVVVRPGRVEPSRCWRLRRQRARPATLITTKLLLLVAVALIGVLVIRPWIVEMLRTTAPATARLPAARLLLATALATAITALVVATALSIFKPRIRFRTHAEATRPFDRLKPMRFRQSHKPDRADRQEPRERAYADPHGPRSRSR